jgi:tetratricopeptide (TPR) repeat protein
LANDADKYLHRFLESFSGRNFIKDAYQKLAWHCLLQGDEKGYEHYINLCKSKGYTIVGSDKSALREAKSGRMPNLLLLKARLLFDGGYFDKAEHLLSKKAASDFVSKKDQLEFTYRMGRINHKLKDYEQALHFYQQTIDEGQRETWYFACRAALEQGHIYESLKEMQKAKTAFKRCLSIKPSEHKTGLHQQAKAGLSRVEN